MDSVESLDEKDSFASILYSDLTVNEKIEKLLTKIKNDPRIHSRVGAIECVALADSLLNY